MSMLFLIIQVRLSCPGPRILILTIGLTQATTIPGIGGGEWQVGQLLSSTPGFGGLHGIGGGVGAGVGTAQDQAGDGAIPARVGLGTVPVLVGVGIIPIPGVLTLTHSIVQAVVSLSVPDRVSHTVPASTWQVPQPRVEVPELMV